MGYLFTWVGLTMLALHLYRVQKRMYLRKRIQEKNEMIELDYITRKGL